MRSSMNLILSAIFALNSFTAQSHAMGSKPALQPSPTPTPTPTPQDTGDAGAAVKEIQSIVQKSQCRNYVWKDRSKAPLSYLEGMALSFSRSLCRERRRGNSATLMAQKDTRNSSVDAVSWYESQFDSKNLEISHAGPDTLRSLYTLGIGLGMRESSGKYCEGNDVSAGAGSANTSEAGTFQFSYDSINASPELKNLYNQYRADPSKCYLAEFSKNVSCANRPVVGRGVGAEFQAFVKRCPAFGAEYAMLSLRVLRKHYGPINRKEAELQVSCNQMLDEVQSYVESRAQNVCEVL